MFIIFTLYHHLLKQFWARGFCQIRFLIGVKVCAVVVLLLSSACSNDQLPSDALLRISPESHSTTIIEQTNPDGQCVFSVANYVDIPLVFELATANGSPVGDTDVMVYADFAANTFSGLPVLSLYNDFNGNGVVDAPNELVSGLDNSIATIRTDTWSGSHMLLLRINLSCAFRGEVVAIAGASSARASIEVLSQASSSNAPFENEVGQ